jgi:hypothetical protein
MATEKRILITKASSQLGVPEASIREAIKPFYPNDWETIKSIKISQFDLITEALRDLATSDKIDENADSNSFQTEENLDLENTNENIKDDAFYTEENLNLENANQEEFDCNLPAEIESTEITVTEPDNLATQEKQQLKVAVFKTFSETAIDLNKITSAMAYSAALKNFASFKEIHSSTFRYYANEYVEEFGGEYQQMLDDLEEQCNPKHFLQECGIIATD